MKVAVLLKTASGIAIDSADAFWREARTLAGVMAPFDARAVEEAVRLRERGQASEIILLAIAGSQVLGALRDGLAVGADRAVLLSDPALDGADMLPRSRALAALLGAVSADLALYCPWSGDIDGSLLWGSAAARLDLPVIAQARVLDVADGAVHCVRQVEQGDLRMTAPLPCMVEVTETINKPRLATLKGKQAARAKTVDVLSLADLGLDAADMARGTTVRSAGPMPERAQPRLLDDPATAAAGIVAFLRERKLLS